MEFDSIVDVVREFGAKNVVVTVPMQPLRFVGLIPGIALTSSSDEPIIVAGFIDESRYKVEEDYKITLESNDTRCGREHFYISDLDSIIRSRPEFRVYYLHEDGFTQVYIK